ncbi:hypothetical protein MNQ98_03565 [Paenibacillus sp. N3/727]|uniref:hypothetical protein n=1 Tax=Paenibacillus sp. N3/727 TaxID=2925845 RepID=UPI001F53BC5F|nr:hypothetical protein [Paenibacillus sp. N3/727]UNK19131.1 hypothetical protein MNQ98_03565 [Paenibacillus sp. N3/727]
MNKLNVVMLSIVFMILMTGCGGVFDQIPKDTVMVKKITKEENANEMEYEGVLSQDAVKTLSLNAVNTYFGENIGMEELEYELLFIDQIKDLLREAESGVISSVEPRVISSAESAVIPRPVEIPQVKRRYQADLEPISSGLYYATLTKRADPQESYEIVLNAKDGDIIKVLKGRIVRGFPSYSEEDLAKVIELASPFIEKRGSYSLSDLSFNNAITRWGNVAELYYTSKDGNELKYSVMVDVRAQKVVGFNKDVMALISYYT